MAKMTNQKKGKEKSTFPRAYEKPRVFQEPGEGEDGQKTKWRGNTK